MNNPNRIYRRRFIISMITYTAVVLGSGWLLRNMGESPLRALVAILPLIPTIFGMWAFMTFVRQIDEFQRRIHFEAFAFSLGCTGIITFTLGLLENEGVPQLSLTWVLPMIIAFWGIGLAIAERRYR